MVTCCHIDFQLYWIQPRSVLDFNTLISCVAKNPRRIGWVLSALKFPDHLEAYKSYLKKDSQKYQLYD